MTELASAGAPGGAALARGLEELRRHAWTPAFESLAQADREGALSAGDLTALAEAAWFTGRADLAIDVKERAFRAYQAEGEPVSAAGIALDLARDHSFKQQNSIAGGWIHRAERLLEGQPETFVHGYLALCRSEVAHQSGSISEAVAQAEEAVAIAGRTGHPDLRASAMTALGMLKIAMGSRSEGFALMEEAATAALSGELSAFMTGVTFCSMISACRDLTDYRRAAEWTAATERWCHRQSVEGFPGICRVHRAEVVAIQGSWERAEAELRQATIELEAFNATPPRAPPPAAAPYSQAQYPQPTQYPPTQHPPAGYPQAPYPPAGYPQAPYPQTAYPEAGYPQAGYPQAQGAPAQAPSSAASYPAGSQPATWGAPPAAEPVQPPPPPPPPAGQPSQDPGSSAAASGSAPDVRGARDRAPILGGLIVVGIGLFLLLGQTVSDAGDWIPLFIGLVFLAAFVARREYGLLVAGSIITGVGAGVVLQDVAPNDLSDAVTTLCIAAGFLSIWVVGTLLRLPGNHWWPFIPGGVLALVGASQVSEADVDGVLRWWPLIIVAIGVLVIARAWLGSRRGV